MKPLAIVLEVIGSYWQHFQVPGLRGAFLATAHAEWGITFAPGTGKLMAQLVMEEDTDIDLSPYSAIRWALMYDMPENPARAETLAS